MSPPLRARSAGWGAMRGRRASRLGCFSRPNTGRDCHLARREATSGHTSAWVPADYDNRLLGGSSFIGGYPFSGDDSLVYDGLAIIVTCAGHTSIDGTACSRSYWWARGGWWGSGLLVSSRPSTWWVLLRQCRTTIRVAKPHLTLSTPTKGQHPDSQAMLDPSDTTPTPGCLVPHMVYQGGVAQVKVALNLHSTKAEGGNQKAHANQE